MNNLASVSLPSVKKCDAENSSVVLTMDVSNKEEISSTSGLLFDEDSSVDVSEAWELYEKMNTNQRDELLNLLLQQSAPAAHAAAASNPLKRAFSRIPALSLTLCLELFASMVVSNMDDVLNNIILLASFLPVISAVSGNAGLQSSTQTVRGLGMGIVKDKHWSKLLWVEFLTNIITGLWIGVAVGLISFVWAEWISPTSVSSAIFGLVVGFSMFLSVIMAGVIGAISPFFFRKMNIDPASSVGPLETSFQDIIGYAIFLNLARALLMHNGSN